MVRLPPASRLRSSLSLLSGAVLLGSGLAFGEIQKNPSYASYPPNGGYAYPPPPQPPVPPAYQPVAPKPSSVPGGQPRLADKVSQLAANDQRQDIRLSQLEKEVDQLSTAGGQQSPPPPPQPVPVKTYQVRKGDTLWRIAMNHRVSPGEVMAFNRMPNDTVTEGQVLMIPQKGAAGKTAAAAGSAIHVVRPGETYSSIAPKYRTSVDKLTKANPTVNPNKLQTGMKLVIPGTVAAGTSLASSSGLPAPPPPASEKKAATTHTVAPGESLSVIAAKHKVSTASLQKANNLANPNALKIGQKLIVPGGNAPASSAAKSAAGSTTKQKPKPAANTASSSGSSSAKPPPAGSGLAMAPSYPGEPPKPPVAPTPPPAPPPGTNRQVVSYRLEPGDTIDSVAKDFGTSTAEIRRLNRLPSSASLKTGDEILVPGMGAVN